MTLTRVLGVDLASAAWKDVGSALLEFDRSTSTFSRVVTPAIRWPAGSLTAEGLSKAIDSFARDHRVSAVAIDGPQGWRSPETPPDLPGVGRRCEYLCRTPGKTGRRGIAYPANQLGWIGFSIDVFSHLLSLDGVSLAVPGEDDADRAYLVLECFPTSAWRSSGLTPLPSKSKKPDLESYRSALATAYGLPDFHVSSHDDLQAVVAGLCAVGAVEGPATARSKGDEARIVGDVRVEGLIWDVEPLRGPVTGAPSGPAVDRGPRHVAAKGAPAVRVTSGVVAQVNRAGASQMQVALRGFQGGTRVERRKVRFRVEDRSYVLVVGDSHAAWRSHQTEETRNSFEELFAIAADTPGAWLPVSLREGEEDS